jgi:hypothetical protein
MTGEVSRQNHVVNVHIIVFFVTQDKDSHII